MEADVSRSLAHRTRLVLRSQHAWVGFEGCRKKIRAVFARRRLSKRPHLFIPRNVGQYYGQPHGNGWRRPSGSETDADGIAGGGLRNRERTLSLRTGV